MLSLNWQKRVCADDLVLISEAIERFWNKFRDGKEAS